MIRTAPDTRWSCGSCSLCCRGVSHGPVEPEIVRGLHEADIASLWPPAAAGWLDERVHPDGTRHAFFTHVDGHCVFLRDDNLCAIHATLGAEAKPGFCREFPYLFVEDARGVAASIREACGGWHHSFTEGDPVQEASAEPAFRAPRVVPRQRFAPPHVVILPGKAIATDTWLTCEPKLLTLPSVGAIRDLLAELVDAELPLPDPDQYEVALQAILAHLEPLLLRGSEVDPRLEPAAGWVQATRSGHREPLGDDGQAFARTVLRNQLLGKRFGAFGQLPAGLGAYLLAHEICRATDLSRYGARLADWSRIASLPPVHRQLRAGSAALATLFLHAD